MSESKEYKCGHRNSPGPGGMTCFCCVMGDKAEQKRRLNREHRRKIKQKLKEKDDETLQKL